MLAIGRPEASEPNTPGWTVRVVPNLFPAFDRHEVVIHSPQHRRTFAELTDVELAAVGQAWGLRTSTAQRRDTGRRKSRKYTHVLINEGKPAGASLLHSHSQIAWLPETPPLVTAELERIDDCPVCAVIEGGRDLIVARRNSTVALVNPAGRLPYEMLIADRHGGLSTFDALATLRAVVRLLRAVEGPVAWNAWLHQVPHPHIEVVPRLSVLAGIELGTGIYVNTVEPARAALALREADVGYPKTQA